MNPLEAHEMTRRLGYESSLQRLLDEETIVEIVLNKKISLPTAYQFLDPLLSLVDASTMTKHAASYYLERSLMDDHILYFKPSVVCASAVVLSINNPDIYVHEGRPVEDSRQEPA